MVSVIFDKLWNDAFRREGKLFAEALELSEIYQIPSAIDAIRLARTLRESGQPFFNYCDTIYKTEKDRALHRLKRRYRLSADDMNFLKELLEKAAKGW